MRHLFIAVVAVFFLLFGSAGFAANSNVYGKHLCYAQGYHCVKVRHGDSWAKMFPNKKKRDIVMRLNRTNIAMYYRSFVVVPNDLDSLDYMDYSPFPSRVNTEREKLLLFDMKKHAFAAYNRHGYQIYWGPISAGKGWCPDVGQPCHTVVGKFKIVRKKGESCISTKFPLPDGGAEMPYCMHFYRGYAIHGSQLPGFHASHGCIRVFKEDAKWLNKSFVSVGAKGTKVIVVR